ncbi:MAG: thiamine pyrophosphate-binding protein [Chloroflexi bacterium]|nr:thiamine pyrophosphate-binding protein [Chloroflexota bacterium]
MSIRQITGNPSELILEQLVASGIKYVFYNSGSREAPFFDSLESRTDINGILALHEGIVTSMAGGFAQVDGKPSAMVVHLGAGLAQCMGQLINVWDARLPVVILTFAGDTGSFGDQISLDLNHSAGPTSIVEPMTKASWTVIEPEGLPAAIERAIRVATTPPMGPVHIAVYDRLLDQRQVTANLSEGVIESPRGGYPADSDLEKIAIALHSAERPMIYVGDGVWKSGAQQKATAIAEHFGVSIASMPNDLRSISPAHPQHAGRFSTAAEHINPDVVLAIGARHGGSGALSDYDGFSGAKQVIALGSDVENLTNMPGLDLAILGDEFRSLERLEQMILSEYEPARYDERRQLARSAANELRAARRGLFSRTQAGRVSSAALLDALDTSLEQAGGGIITTEQFATPLESVNPKEDGGANTYLRPAGGSEGYGMGAVMGAKLAAPDRPVVGLVGDGSMYYSDSALWTAVHHKIPVLWTITNNGAYGIVAGAFSRADGNMNSSGDYAGVVLDGIEPVKIAEAYGVEGKTVTDEATVGDEISRALELVEREKRPYLLDVRLPLGLPEGGRAAAPYELR